jgi:hypothetical protein
MEFEMSNTTPIQKLFTISFNQFEKKTEVAQNVPFEYFSAQNNFTDNDRKFISELKVTEDMNYQHSYTRGAGVKEGYQRDQPKNTFKVIRTQ